MFVPPHNPGNYPPMTGSTQEKALGTKRSRKKTSSFPTLRRHRQGDQKPDSHGGASILTVSIDGLVDRIWESHGAIFVPTLVQFPWGNWQDRPKGKLGKHSQDDGALLPHINPCPPHQPTRKWAGVYKSRREDNCQWNDGVKSYHPFGPNSYT